MLNRDYQFDFVFVIDATGSMGPIIDRVKQSLCCLPSVLVEGMEASNRRVSKIRIKLIDFADFGSVV